MKSIPTNIPTIKALIVLVVVVVLTTALLLLESYKNQRLVNEEKTKAHANAVVNQISDVITQVSDITTHLSSSHEVRDLMAMGSPEEVQAWTTRTRKLFPHIVGLSLTSLTGEIIGDKGSQYIGRLCERDLNVYARGGKVFYPPVHRDVSRLEHFDILKTIRDDEGEDIGLLLTSYRLSVVQGIIDRVSEDEYFYQIFLQGQTNLIEKGKRGLPYTVRLMIPGTEWELIVSSDTRPGNQLRDWLFSEK